MGTPETKIRELIRLQATPHTITLDTRTRARDESELITIRYETRHNASDSDLKDELLKLSPRDLDLEDFYTRRADSDTLTWDNEAGDWIRIQITDYSIYVTIFYSAQY
jgi:hypothetical protein